VQSGLLRMPRFMVSTSGKTVPHRRFGPWPDATAARARESDTTRQLIAKRQAAAERANAAPDWRCPPKR